MNDSWRFNDPDRKAVVPYMQAEWGNEGHVWSNPSHQTLGLLKMSPFDQVDRHLNTMRCLGIGLDDLRETPRLSIFVGKNLPHGLPESTQQKYFFDE